MLEHDLRLAIARDELQLVYQPQTEMQSGTVTGFEALLRWQQPDARQYFSRDFHSDCRGDRRHSGNRGLGTEDSLPRGRNMAANR